MRTYPVMLKLSGQRVLVVGAGAVAERRARGLLAAGAEVTVVAPTPGPAAELAGVNFIQNAYSPAHLAGCRLAFACTSSRQVNAAVAADARAAGVWVNAADQPEDCDFFSAATFADGAVVVAVGTGGAAPGLAGQLRRQLADALPPDVGAFAAALAELRPTLQHARATAAGRHALWQELAGPAGQQAFADGGPAALAELADTLIAQPPKGPSA